MPHPRCPPTRPRPATGPVATVLVLPVGCRRARINVDNSSLGYRTQEAFEQEVMRVGGAA